MASSAVMAWKNRYEKAKLATRRVRAKAGETMEGVLNAGVASAAGFGLGALAGSLKDPKDWVVAGVPIPIWAGAGAHGLALLGVGRGMETHFRAFGNGCFAVHAFGMGRKLIEQRAQVSTSGESQLLGSHGRAGSGITERDLAAMALS